MPNPISAFSAGLIQQSIGNTNSRFAATIAHIASGRRLAQASEDVAALSAATSLQTEVSGLRSAALNITQASSMLQVADGGMNQIGQMLDRMSQLSVQANSGALSASGREGLNREFQNLAREIDRLANQTNFNGVPLLNGAQSARNELATNTSRGAQASGALQFNANVGAGQTVQLNGVTLTEGVDFQAGATASQTVSNLANRLNSDRRFDGFTFSATNATLNIRSDAAGAAGNQFTISQAGSTANFNVVGDALSGAGTFSLQGGTDAGVSAGDVRASGVIGDRLVTAQDSRAASTTARFNSAADISVGDTISIDNGEGGQTTFTFVAGPTTNPNQISIGANLQDTLQNAANTINNYRGADDYGVRQLNATVDGRNLVISNQTAGNATSVTGAALAITLGTTGGALSNATLNNGSTGGVDVSGLTVANVSGGFQDVTASFTGANSVALSVDVGGETFRATVSNTNAATNSTVRFTSENGGFFDVTFAGGEGMGVGSQLDANRFAARLDSALGGVNLTQTRDVSSFIPTGRISGSSLQVTGGDFSLPLQVDGVQISTTGTTAQFNITVNGQTFRSGAIGSNLAAGEVVTLTGDDGDVITYTNGTQAVNLSTTVGANNFKSDISTALGLGATGTGGGSAFQVGATSDDQLNLSIGNLTTQALFGGQAFNLLSASGAAEAAAGVGRAIDTLTSQRADVGAFQQALGYTAANLNSAIQNQEAARSVFTDTDLASEATLNALLQTQNQAGIATLAQTNRLSGNLLQLLVK